MILSADLIVESLCAIAKIVFSPRKLNRTEHNSSSVFKSKEEVASSKIKISGFEYKALAIAKRCF